MTSTLKTSLKKSAKVAAPMALLIVAFQNCAPEFSADGVGSPSGAKSNSSSSTGVPTAAQPLDGSSSASAGGPLGTGGTTTMPIASTFQSVDKSTSDGSKIIRLVSTITGGGAGLRGCTNPIANAATACKSDADFNLISNAWGASSYNAATDTYSIDQDVSTFGYPHTTYFSRFILANGSRFEVTWTPTKPATTVAPASGLKWVYTKVQFCVGPSPQPAPIGAACTIRGQTMSNACGTATCQ